VEKGRVTIVRQKRLQPRLPCLLHHAPVSITAALADRPIAGIAGSISVIKDSGLNSATQNLAIEYANDGIRFIAVAPGVVHTPMHRNDPQELTLAGYEKGDGKG
jgi:Enoyl-(Acyl carrier protein) reductase